MITEMKNWIKGERMIRRWTAEDAADFYSEGERYPVSPSLACHYAATDLRELRRRAWSPIITFIVVIGVLFLIGLLVGGSYDPTDPGPHCHAC